MHEKPHQNLHIHGPSETQDILTPSFTMTKDGSVAPPTVEKQNMIPVRLTLCMCK